MHFLLRLTFAVPCKFCYPCFHFHLHKIRFWFPFYVFIATGCSEVHYLISISYAPYIHDLQFILLWSENKVIMTSISLKLLRFDLLPDISSIQRRTELLCKHTRRMHILLLSALLMSLAPI